MKTLHTVKPEAPRVFLAGIQVQNNKKAGKNSITEPAGYDMLTELIGLTNTLDLSISAAETYIIREQNPRYGMGSGKAKELSEMALASGAECIIFDQDLSPSQQRNWEELSGMAVIDRQELIIRIFASRARTREAELQAELAELLYFLPRLTHKYVDLARQRGGRYGTRGEGETRLETDRRHIRQRINVLRKDIEAVRNMRKLQRKQREKQGIPVCALVGYTNAGKSSLHQALSGSDVLVEDKLFATLDPTARRVNRLMTNGERKTMVFIDTVGFIRRLPHNLVDAFRATLEEAAQADVLIHVLDAADPDIQNNNNAVLQVLEELGAGKIPRITALNKSDLLTETAIAALELSKIGVGTSVTAISAKKKEGLENLWILIEKTFKF